VSNAYSSNHGKEVMRVLKVLEIIPTNFYFIAFVLAIGL
jgi:hypothetical protein